MFVDAQGAENSVRAVTLDRRHRRERRDKQSVRSGVAARARASLAEPALEDAQRCLAPSFNGGDGGGTQEDAQHRGMHNTYTLNEWHDQYHGPRDCEVPDKRSNLPRPGNSATTCALQSRATVCQRSFSGSSSMSLTATIPTPGVGESDVRGAFVAGRAHHTRKRKGEPNR